MDIQISKSAMTAAAVALVIGVGPAHATDIKEARAACERIESVYNACEPSFQFDGRDFKFAGRAGTTVVTCTDGQQLGFFDRLDRMDIASIFMFPYKKGVTPLPEARPNWDPGRLRSEELLIAVFGHDEASVRANLTTVHFLGQDVLFQKKLGAAAALARVDSELSAAAEVDPTLAQFLLPFTSKKENLREYTFFWRNVAGSSRLSTHSFGTAIDLLRGDETQYWLWDEKKHDPARAAQGEAAYRNVPYVPAKAPSFHPIAVQIFEHNGFIWGGKWNHYDTMHFEYRPEFFDNYKVDCTPQK